MLKMRLKRIGKKHQPLYRIVVTEHTQAVSGQYVEKIGNYNPFTKEIILDQEKTLAWLNKGVKPSNTVAKLLEKSGLKHKLIIIKKFRAKSKVELETEKKAEEEKKTQEQAGKEAAKEAFAKEVEEKKIQAEEAKKEEKEAEAEAEEQKLQEKEEPEKLDVDKSNQSEDNKKGENK